MDGPRAPLVATVANRRHHRRDAAAGHDRAVAPAAGEVDRRRRAVDVWVDGRLCGRDPGARGNARGCRSDDSKHRSFFS